LGLSTPPFDMLWVLKTVQKFTVREAFDPEEIRDQIKENRMLYEMDEISEEEYERRHSRLQDDLERAKRAREMNHSKRIDLL